MGAEMAQFWERCPPNTENQNRLLNASQLSVPLWKSCYSVLLYFLLVSGKPSIQKRSQKPGVNRKFQFFVYSPDVDRECEALKVCCMLYVVCCAISLERSRS